MSQVLSPGALQYVVAIVIIFIVLALTAYLDKKKKLIEIENVELNSLAMYKSVQVAKMIASVALMSYLLYFIYSISRILYDQGFDIFPTIMYDLIIIFLILLLNFFYEYDVTTHRRGGVILIVTTWVFYTLVFLVFCFVVWFLIFYLFEKNLALNNALSNIVISIRYFGISTKLGVTTPFENNVDDYMEDIFQSIVVFIFSDHIKICLMAATVATANTLIKFLGVKWEIAIPTEHEYLNLGLISSYIKTDFKQEESSEKNRILQGFAGITFFLFFVWLAFIEQYYFPISVREIWGLDVTKFFNFAIVAVHLSFCYIVVSIVLQESIEYRKYSFIIVLVLSMIFAFGEFSLLFSFHDIRFIDFWKRQTSLLKIPVSLISYFILSFYSIFYAAVVKANRTIGEKIVEVQKKFEFKCALMDTKLREKELEKNLLTTQLASLKHQIDAHFLFNSLNFLRYKSGQLAEADSLSESIVLLADIMRYSVEGAGDRSSDTVVTKVSLESEIEHIKNYIKFNQLRSLGELHVHTEIAGKFKFRVLPPLILINFVENAFKYGDLTDEAYPLMINIGIRFGTLHMKVTNKKYINTLHNHVKSMGVGNVNTKNRLDLAYPDNYTLEILDEPDFYNVDLTINL